MKRELLSKVIGDIDDRFIAEAYRPACDLERSVHVKKKRLLMKKYYI